MDKQLPTCTLLKQASEAACVFGDSFRCYEAPDDIVMSVTHGCRGQFCCGGTRIHCGRAGRQLGDAGTSNCSCALSDPLAVCTDSTPEESEAAMLRQKMVLHKPRVTLAGSLLPGWYGNQQSAAGFNGSLAGHDVQGRRRVTLLHIPKCGSWFHTTLWATHCPDVDVCALLSGLANRTTAVLSTKQRRDLRAHCAFADVRTSTVYESEPPGHRPWHRGFAPYGAVVLRDPRARLVSAFSFREGHIEPQPLWRFKHWWRCNISRYARFPGVLGCQTKMLLGFDCMEPVEGVASTPTRVRAVRILLEDFIFWGLTEECKTSTSRA